jgi:shikimate dehydrogenase
VSGARRGAAVLGSPIAHSLSPVLHQAAYDALGLDGWTYRAVECNGAALLDMLRLLETEGLAGVSLTMPLKRAVLPLLARMDRVAEDVGGANTVLFGGIPGEWFGANTDVPGMVAALEGLVSGGSDVACVLGGGATAASALAALRDLGYARCVVCVRRPGASSHLEEVAARVGVAIEVTPWDQAPALVRDAGLVIATTPADATDALAPEVSPSADAVLFDVVYAPWPTPLATAWSSRGGQVIGGLELLVQQASLQVKLMTGRDAPVDLMRVAGEAALHRET